MTRCARNGCRIQCPAVVTTFGLFGAFVDGRWYCSARCLERTLSERLSTLPPVSPAWVQGWLPVKLGTLLARQAGLSAEAITRALEIQSRSGVPLGQTLRMLGLITPEDLLRALATQAGVRYLTTVNPDVVAHQPGHLSHNTVRTLGIVPVAADAKRQELQVACTAPIPGHAVRALSRLTTWAVEPLLVSDDTLPYLVNAYTSAGQRASSFEGAVCDARSGAATVARIARSLRSVKMRHERCDPYVWVRLESPRLSADVLMALAPAGR